MAMNLTWALLVSSLLTSVCTIAGRCVLSILTVWKISTTPSYLILSNTILRVMNTPVLPTPALLQKHKNVNRLSDEKCLI